MRGLAYALLPQLILGRLRQLREQYRNRTRSAEDVFTEIYETAAWGGRRGELCSGSGSADREMVAAYVAAVAAKAASEGFLGRTFVDLGCGDFRVGKELLPLCSRYVGVDVVAAVVERNEREHGDATTRFVHLDIVRDPLPDGDVCFVRHVLQHLSNPQILAILPKLAKYRWVFITEHHPTDDDRIVPNRDMVHGGYVRLSKSSGVYLGAPPFALPEQCLTKVMEIPGVSIGAGRDAGVIRTFLYEPRR
jgi:SAM-dependent methyltransferase